MQQSHLRLLSVFVTLSLQCTRTLMMPSHMYPQLCSLGYTYIRTSPFQSLVMKTDVHRYVRKKRIMYEVALCAQHSTVDHLLLTLKSLQWLYKQD